MALAVSVKHTLRHILQRLCHISLSSVSVGWYISVTSFTISANASIVKESTGSCLKMLDISKLKHSEQIEPRTQQRRTLHIFYDINSALYVLNVFILKLGKYIVTVMLS